MDWSTIAKYTAGLVLNGAVFYLTVMKMVDPQVFVSMATGELSALGIYHATTQSPNTVTDGGKP